MWTFNSVQWDWIARWDNFTPENLSEPKKKTIFEPAYPSGKETVSHEVVNRYWIWSTTPVDIETLKNITAENLNQNKEE